MTLYETIYARRQARKYDKTPLPDQTLADIEKFIAGIDQIPGLIAQFEIVGSEKVTGGSAPHYIISSCDDNAASYANVGYALQKLDLHIQSLGLGCGWFAGVSPKDNRKRHCISLAFGATDIPMRQSPGDFKRLPIHEISPLDNSVAQAVRLAPSAMNSQPWKLEFADGKVTVQDFGRGLMRVILKNKLNKIDIGIAARHAALALEYEGKKITNIIPQTTGKEFAIEILYE